MSHQANTSFGFDDQVLTADHMVQAALKLICANHEIQLAKYSAILDGKKPAIYKQMVDQYHYCLENTMDTEEAFVTFLKTLEKSSL
ncbi:MAG: hypothetical protein VKJ04_10050 [Vampirovibrionales bacterium]|nr:hypothetical protein [Vampirovibrionales bacterium]